MPDKFTYEEKIFREKEIVRLREEKKMTYAEIAEEFTKPKYEKMNRRGLFDIGANRINGLYSKIKQNGYTKPEGSAEEEPAKRFEMSEVEKLLIRVLPAKWKWIVRDKNGDLHLFENKPIKITEKHDMWGNDPKGYCMPGISDFPYKNYFKFIKWADEEPTRIEDLLKEAKYDFESEKV